MQIETQIQLEELRAELRKRLCKTWNSIMTTLFLVLIASILIHYQWPNYTIYNIFIGIVIGTLIHALCERHDSKIEWQYSLDLVNSLKRDLSASKDELVVDPLDQYAKPLHEDNTVKPLDDIEDIMISEYAKEFTAKNKQQQTDKSSQYTYSD